MSHLSKIFEEAPIKVQNRNGFDLSHIHAGTSKTGQLVPVLTKLLPPNSTISLGVQAEVSLPPLVAPFYGKVDFAIEGFIVPCSILYGGWKQFISNQQDTMFPVTQSALTSNATASTVVSSNVDNSWGKTGYSLPYFSLLKVSRNNIADFRSSYLTNDNIYDYMGMAFRTVPNFSASTDLNVSLLPALAYHKICDVFYRNTKLTRTWFEVNPNWEYTGPVVAADAGYKMVKNVSMIWHSWYTDKLYSYGGTTGNTDVVTASAEFDNTPSLTFPDTISVFKTRQRTYNRDYFTSAVPSPQQGGAATLQFSVDTGTSDGSFTINALRMANSLQKFLETNNLSGDYAETMRNRWGVRPIDADFDEPHYLGRVVVPVYQHTVSKQDAIEANYDTAGSGVNSPNPYAGIGILGSKAANGGANGEGSICDNFNVSTWSYLMVLASLYPHANYNYGINRELTMTKLGDFPAPELQSVGMEEIKNYEISSYATSFSEASKWFSTFGYIPRYSRFKYMDDFVSGELRPARTLAQYQIQRDFGTTMPELGTDFVTIQPEALDNVLSVGTNEMNLSCWWEIFFNFKVVMPLADFCIPTLGELGDTHTIKTTVSGSRL